MNTHGSVRWVVPAGVWALLALQLVVVYSPSVPGPPSQAPHTDKIVHALIFAAPVLLAGLGRWRRWPWVAVVCALHAPVSEVLQHFLLSGRSGDPWDVVADLGGVVGASIGVSLWLRRPRRRL